MNKRPSWQQYWMMMAKFISSRSTCSSRPVGAVLVRENKIVTTGYNGAPSGYPHCTDQGDNYCYRRESKVREENKQNVCPSVHAEVNCITMAAKRGISTEGSELYITLSPCLNCSKILVGSGVKTIFYELLYESENQELDDYWKESTISYGITHFEQITIKSETYEYILKNLQNPTSLRRELEEIK
jgi:dCMP deaminase